MNVSPDVLQLIISYLDIIALPTFFDKHKINKQIKFFAETERKYFTTYLRNTSNNHHIPFFLNLTSLFPSMSLTHVTINYQTNTNQLQQYIILSPFLSSLTLYNSDIRDNLDLHHIKKLSIIDSKFQVIHAPNIKYLKIINSPTSNIILNINNLKTLITHITSPPFDISQAINLHHLKFSDHIINDVHTIIPTNIRSLHLIRCTIKHINLVPIPSLTKLKLIHCKNAENIMYYTPNLHSLTLETEYYTYYISPMYNLQYIRRLNISTVSYKVPEKQNPMINCRTLNIYGRGPVYVQTPNLTTLNLINNNTHPNFAHSYQNLQNITFQSCTFTNINDLFHCKFIRNLSIEKCHKLTDIDALYNFHNLEHLTIKICNNLINIYPIRGCKNLHTLILHWTIEAKTITHIHEPLTHLYALTECHNLKILHIDNPVLKTLSGLPPRVSTLILTNTLIQNINEINPTLQTLEINNSYHLMDINVPLIHLHTLTLLNCPNIISATHINNFVNLRYLTLKKCPSILDISLLTHINPHYLNLSGCSLILDLNILSTYTSLRHLVLNKQMLTLSTLSPLSSYSIELI